MTRMVRIASAVMLCIMAFASCSAYEDFSVIKGVLSEGAEIENSPEGDHSGVLTAGEWNDLDNWGFWGSVSSRSEIAKELAKWGFNTEHRIAIKLSDTKGNAIAGSRVEATVDGNTVWSSRTDNHGTANCWISMFDGNGPSDASVLRILIDGKEMPGAPVISYAQDGDAKYNEYKSEDEEKTDGSIDIAFIVDATGSMDDEINFLKDDLEDIIVKCSASGNCTSIRTGSVFYRDTDDDYLTRISEFTEDLRKTIAFIKEQCAEGGGDHPEAVDAALEASLDKLSWNLNARSRIAFLILDAPAHDLTKAKESLHKSIETYSKNGIILIPVMASGADLSTEMMLRSFAIATNGTYTFLTDDSGVGGEHIEASVGEYEVEKLNDLLVRLIGYYME